jgi:hypothetical protein
MAASPTWRWLIWVAMDDPRACAAVHGVVRDAGVGQARHGRERSTLLHRLVVVLRGRRLEFQLQGLCKRESRERPRCVSGRGSKIQPGIAFDRAVLDMRVIVRRAEHCMSALQLGGRLWTLRFKSNELDRTVVVNPCTLILMAIG